MLIVFVLEERDGVKVRRESSEEKKAEEKKADRGERSKILKGR